VGHESHGGAKLVIKLGHKKGKWREGREKRGGKGGLTKVHNMISANCAIVHNDI
jgi:hypothetical protein